MGFLTYSNTVNYVIDKIVDALVAADAAHFAKITTGSLYKAAVHYTGNGEDKYIQFKNYKCASTINKDGDPQNYCHMTCVQVGTSWNDSTKEVEGSPTNYYAAVGWNSSDISSTIFNTNTLNHILYVDKDGIQWCCWNPYTANYAEGFFMSIDFIPIAKKEYDDASSCITFASFGYPYNYGNSGSAFYRTGEYASFTSDSLITDQTNYCKGYKSIGNNKIYFEFPKYHKNPTTFTNPYFINKRWFIMQKVGVAANDIISWLDTDGITVRKFIVCECGGANGQATFYYCLPYDNPVTY